MGYPVSERKVERMSKCHPNKKKLRRRLQNEHKKEVARLEGAIHYNNHQISGFFEKTEALRREIEEKRVIIRELGDNHKLKYDKPSDDGTLVSFARVDAADLEVRAAGYTKDAVEEQLVHKIALELIKKNLVRIEAVEPRSYEDMQRGTVTFTARIDVIPWYKCVKPECVFLDMDASRMIMREGESK